MARWIKGAVKHPGAFTAQAKAAGESVHAFAEAHKHDSGTTGARARLALTFEGMHAGTAHHVKAAVDHAKRNGG